MMELLPSDALVKRQEIGEMSYSDRKTVLKAELCLADRTKKSKINSETEVI